MGAKTPERTEELRPFLTVEDTCALLGISRSAGYRAIGGEWLPVVRWGRRVYVPAGHLVSLLGTTSEELAAKLARIRSDREAAIVGGVTMQGIRSSRSRTA
ncbi:MAG: hypothetical protein NVSMB32_00570 [Actinomycetota bacterium]